MDRRVKRTKSAIKNALERLLCDKSSSKITVTDIAKAANIDRKTFYLHFDSTESVMEELLEDNLTELDDMLNQNGSSENPIDVATIFHCINACIMKKMDFYQSITGHADFEILAAHAKDIIIRRNIENLSQTTGLSPEELLIYSKFIFSGVIDIYIDWFRNKIPLSLEDLGKLTGNIVDQGIRVLSPNPENIS